MLCSSLDTSTSVSPKNECLPKAEKRTMSQIYVPAMTRAYHKRQLDGFAWTYFERLHPTFFDISKEADTAADEYYNDTLNMSASDDFDDAASVAEEAIEKGLTLYETLSLGEYTLTAAWHATLYEFFEQQLRLFLYKELTNDYILDFRTFCTSMKDIKQCLEAHDFDVQTISTWSCIDELRLLCNVIKHSDGTSASDLRKRNPLLFKNMNGIDYLKLYQTTLLEISLDINETTLRNYVGALHAFWDEIPERNYSKDSRTVGA